MTRSAPAAIRPTEFSQLAKRLYQDAPVLQRLLSVLRPYILPLDGLVTTVPQRADMLDIGCGTGLFLAVLTETGRIRSGTGVEPNDRARASFEIMQARCRQDIPLAVQATRSPADWPRGPYEAVSLIDVLHHVAPDERAALLDAAVARVAPGGVLILKDIAGRPRWKAMANRLHDLLLTGERVQYIDFTATRASLCDRGLTVRTHRRLDVLWYSHELLVLERRT